MIKAEFNPLEIFGIFIIGIAVGVFIGVMFMQSCAVRNNAAYYSPYSAEFRWNDQKP